MPGKLSLIVCLAACSLAPAQTPSLLRDIHTAPPPEPSAWPQDLVAFGGHVYYSAETPLHGRELCRSDGTPAGTTVFADIRPGPASSTPGAGAATASRLFFSADHPTAGYELFVTDGDPANTRLVVDLEPGSTGSEPYELAALGDRVVFRARRADVGAEPWISDGTAAGTTLVRDIAPGAGSSFPERFTAVAGRIVFRTGSRGVWSTDGTAAGTAPLPGPADFEPLGPLGNRLVFSSGLRELWITDGTPGGTARLPSIADIDPYRVAAIGNHMYFAAQWNTLWRTDGTAAGTLPVATLPARTYVLGATGGRVVLSVAVSLTEELWVSDGTAAGTVRLRSLDIWPSPGMEVGGGLLLRASGPNGEELYRTDGTLAGTFELADIWPGPIGGVPAFFTRFGSEVAFAARDAAHGAELWITDGTTIGTRLAGNVARWPAGWTGPSDPSDGVDWNGRAVFMASSPDPEPWISSGSAATTAKYGPFPPGTSFWEFSYHYGNQRLLTSSGRLTTISTDSSTYEQTLWSDSGGGPAPGTTTTIADPHDPLRRWEEAAGIAWIENESGMWRVDGNLAQRLLPDFEFQGVGRVGGLAAVTKTGSLHACDRSACATVWTAPAGVVIDRKIVAWGHRAVIGLDDPGGVHEVLVSDGTPSGTTTLDLASGSALNSVRAAAGTRDFALVSAASGSGLAMLWRIAGTPPAASLVASTAPFTPDGETAVALGADRMITLIRDASRGVELHEVDAHAVRLVADLSPGAADSRIELIRAVGGEVWFRFGAGRELWRTDGTAAGTRRVFAGAHTGDLFVAAAGRVYFDHDDGPHGNEPWVVDAGATAQPIGAPCSGSFRAPWLAATDPVLGGTWTIDGGGGRPGAVGVALLGFPATIAQPLPPDCAEFVDRSRAIAVLHLQLDASRPWRLAAALPNDAALVGVDLATQYWTGPGDGRAVDASAGLALHLDTW